MRVLVYIVCFLRFSGLIYGSDTTRVLFVGNSFTYFNNMPQLFKTLADSSHVPVVVGMHAPAGVSVGDTAQGSMAHMNNPALFALIRSKKWDFVVIQDNQGRFVLDSAVFPTKSKVVQGHLNIMDSVKANNACAKVILFGGWGWKYGSPPYGNTGSETIQRILRNYVVLNDTMKEVIAPIGEAWIRSVTQNPGINLWDSDDTHPSYSGSYLTASVLFSVVFDLPAKNSNYHAGLSASDALNLRISSDSAVFNPANHSKYNLGGIKKINLQLNNGQLTVPGSFSAIYWYKENQYVGNTASLSYTANSRYSALIKELDGCLVKSCGMLEFLSGMMNQSNAQTWQIFPNPLRSGALHIRSQENIRSVRVLDVFGQELSLHIELTEKEAIINMEGLAAGTYFLLLSGERNNLQRKIWLEP